ncbi:SRPBCC family protein [Actinomadura luteofluorescens]|uniref:SRPBCC family protein n=1 Tax=Actinomadura luteofluorescens TaxID=46163 RepID=UPI003D94B296
MARANPMGKLPVGQIAKRLPIGGRKRSSGLSAITKALPGGRAIGTAGGVLLGAGAAVAASRAIAGNRGAQGSDQDDQEQPKASSAKNGAKDETEKDAKSGAKDEAKADAKKDDAKDAKDAKDEQSDGKGKGIFGKLKNILPGGGKGKGGKGGGKKVKVTNIIEHTDIGAPARLVYDQWTQFQDYPSFMKKVISVDQADDTKLNWKAKIFWSARTWESTIVEQVPDEHIVWRSKGPKGHVDGTVSFHELSPNLTRVLVVLEYHPQGFMERTGNIWRAQGRRARLELKHFRRYVMTNSLTRADEIEGWRGEIRDSEVVRTHEEAMEEEEKSGKGGSATSKDKGSESAKESKDAKDSKDSEARSSRNGRGTRSSSSGTSRTAKSEDREEEYEEAR